MKRLVLSVCILILVTASAFADPIPLLDDFTQDYILHYDESNPDAGHYEYVYHYPHVDPAAPGAAPIEKYYEDKDSDSQNFSMLINGDYYRESGISVKTEITYTITCNNDDYFSVLFKISDSAEGNESVSYVGNVFSREEGKADSTYTLPQLLKILSYTEDDEWLQERQTAKAETLVRKMIWEQIQENRAGIEYYDDFDEAQLEENYNPEEDFYLDEKGDPVFFLQPGMAADESYGLLTFPIPLEDILDEL
jgi:hypothetical protein